MSIKRTVKSPSDLPRVDFIHWVMVDLPPTLREVTEGQFSAGFTTRGKAGPATLLGARHGLNDYTGWFAGNADMSGNYFGYDGPFPPFNDSILHHYVFTVYALDLADLQVEGNFTGADVHAAMTGHVLDEACHDRHLHAEQAPGLKSRPKYRSRLGVHPHHRHPPRRNHLERGHPHPRAARHPAERNRPVAGEATWH
jgi:Raf kinase inhibitor-like YbhB/YbcL family protein